MPLKNYLRRRVDRFYRRNEREIDRRDIMPSYLTKGMTVPIQWILLETYSRCHILYIEWTRWLRPW